jgi:hypothetical protein
MTGPHDRFFRYIFNPPARAEALLRHNLPAPHIAELDWSSLRRESGTLVIWERETRQDLLFSVRYLHAAADDPPHFLVIEHQSSVERRIVRYLHQLGDDRVRGAIHRVLHSIMESERAEAIMKTAADVLREEGHSRGLAEGEAKGLAKALL